MVLVDVQLDRACDWAVFVFAAAVVCAVPLCFTVLEGCCGTASLCMAAMLVLYSSPELKVQSNTTTRAS